MRTYRVKKSKADTCQNHRGQSNGGRRRGRLNIVGIGPGHLLQMSGRSRRAVNESDVIVGYRTYIRLLGPELTAGKEIVSTGMTEEIARARLAISAARRGKTVSVISSGDPGVYGMAGPVLELLRDEDLRKIDVEVIPGIISATACASLLGAPLGHDFAAVSLSDLLTDPALIRRRIELAAKGDFVIILYNPKSASRTEPFETACRVLLKYRPPRTPVGIVRNAYRDGQEIILTNLRELPSSDKVDMLSTVIIGSSKTYVKGNFMITPRGYNLEAQCR